MGLGMALDAKADEVFRDITAARTSAFYVMHLQLPRRAAHLTPVFARRSDCVPAFGSLWLLEHDFPHKKRSAF